MDRTKRILRGIPALHVRSAINALDRRYGAAPPLAFIQRDMERRVGEAVAEKLSMTFVGHDFSFDSEVFEMKVYAFTEAEMAVLVERITSGQLG
ncbi:hypothetical protein [Variovorax paradoxus]|uniref:hypothetical protein n=1 Tax=Variovorax paradoxus TaxID=34073 RepID=UPI0028658BAC|nr:hypothetical protein [Variovorax paradoxus]MDR6455516.1 hypothetical protein [Variovorax paradoxus]